MKYKEKQILKFSVIDNKTGEYPDLYTIALKEDWAKGLLYCDMEGFSVNEDGQLILSDECGKFVYCPSDRFTVVFEDSIVLSREEYEKGIIERESMRNQITELFNDREQARRETAEKLLNDFKLWAREYQYKDTVVDENGERPMTNNEKLNYLYTYLCDKYKVEIKE